MHVRPREEIRFESRRHPVVLWRPLGKAVVLAAAGGASIVLAGWPWSVPGALAVVLSAFVALRAVWRWERARFVVTSERLIVVHGTLRRRTVSVTLAGIGPLEVEQTLLGRLLGYGTVLAGDLEVEHVPDVRRTSAVVDRLAHR